MFSCTRYIETGCTAAHLGFDKTYAKISERYFWQTMRKDIQNFVRSCPQCQTRKNPVKITRAPLIPIPLLKSLSIALQSMLLALYLNQNQA